MKRYVLKEGGAVFTKFKSLKEARKAKSEAQAKRRDGWRGLSIFDRKKEIYVD